MFFVFISIKTDKTVKINSRNKYNIDQGTKYQIITESINNTSAKKTDFDFVNENSNNNALETNMKKTQIFKKFKNYIFKISNLEKNITKNLENKIPLIEKCRNLLIFKKIYFI